MNQRLSLHWDKWRKLVVLGIVVSVVGCGSNSVSVSGVTISVAHARAVAAAYDVANNEANFTLNTTLQNNHEEGTAAQIDDAAFAASKLEGLASIPDTTPATPTWTNVITVPSVKETPGFFFDEISSTVKGVNFIQLMVFQQDSLQSPWRVSIEPTMNTSKAWHLSIPHAQESNGIGTVEAASNTAPLTQLASYWDQFRNPKTSLGNFVRGPYTTQRNAQFETSFGSTPAGSTATLQTRVVAPTPAVSVTLTHGDTMLMGAIRSTITLKGGANYTFTQPSNLSVFPPQIAPGTYSSITFTQIDDVALVVPSSGTEIDVVGDYNGVISASGTLVAAGKGGTTALAFVRQTGTTNIINTHPLSGRIPFCPRLVR